MLIEQLINGLTLGSIYVLVATGYTIVFGLLDIINMAHGEIFMLGSFMGMLIITKYNAPLWLAFLVAILSTSMMGYILELTALRPLRRKKNMPALAPLISTIGFSICLQNILHHIFGAGNEPFITHFGNLEFNIGTVNIYLVQIIILVISVLIIAGLTIWLAKSKIGKALRCTAENPEMAELMGINTAKIINLTIIMASAMGGIAGVLIGMSFNFINVHMGASMGLKGLAIIILGGMGNIYGTMVGGILIGMSETLFSVYIDSNYRDSIAFIVIILVLIFKPQGLFRGGLSKSR